MSVSIAGPDVPYNPIMHRMEPRPVTRESLAREILLKLLEADRDICQHMRKLDQNSDEEDYLVWRSEVSLAKTSIAIADALLAELGKPKEGA